MNQPFGHNASAYWAKAFSVIPISPGTKQPAGGIKSWTGYCDNLPKPESRASWMQKYSNYGIGLCLGSLITSEFRLGAVDVDDDSLVRVAASILGSCPCAKRGKKGITYLVRVPRNGKLKSCKISNHAKLGVVDVLIGGRMTVLPPTTHPETNKPYVWIGSSLLDVDVNALPILGDQQLAMLKLVIGSEEASVIATGEATHEAGLRLVAKLVRHGSDDATITGLFRAYSPMIT